MKDINVDVKVYAQHKVKKVFTFTEKNAEYALRAVDLIPESVTDVENVSRSKDAIKVNYRMRGRGNKGNQSAEISVQNAVGILFHIHPSPGVKSGKAALTSEGIQVFWTETTEEQVGSEKIEFLEEMFDRFSNKPASEAEGVES